MRNTTLLKAGFAALLLTFTLPSCSSKDREDDEGFGPGPGDDGGPGDGGDGGGDDGGTGGDDGGDDGGDGGDGGGDDGGDDGGIKFDIGSGGDVPGGGGDDGGGGDTCKYLDILFIVDISGSMQEEKANLNANFPNFIGVLDDYVNDPSKGALGYRIGATNSSHQSDGSTTGLDGALVNGNGPNDDCGTGGQYWLDGPAPNLPTNFACLATNPRACGNSCSDLGRERPLDSLMGFIDKHAPGQTNEGFYRGDESLLVVVTLTDEDDQSDVTPAGAKTMLDAFTSGDERYVIVTVAGQENTGCNSAFGDATAAPRLHQFTNSVPNGLMGNICDGDLTQALQDALDLITFSCDELPPPQG